MKVRSGFVSNSSSSSFTCNVCGNTESGMDASARDFEMTQCVNGHCFCDSHADNLPDPSPEQIRKSIKEQINGYRWRDEVWKTTKLSELESTPDDDLEDLLEEYGEDGCNECSCPICSMNALDDGDGYRYLKQKYGLSNQDILNEIRLKFNSYSELQNFISPKEKSE